MTVWEREIRTLWRRSGTRIVLLPPGSSDPVLVEGVGGRAWELLEEPWDEQRLVSELAGGYGVAPATVRAGLLPFLTRLLELGAVRRGTNR